MIEFIIRGEEKHMSKEEIKLTSVDGYELSLAVFKAENPKAVIQMVHGMEEHKERYYDFCEFLAKQGFSSVVSDLRGHGSNAPLLSHISDKHGERLLIDDQREIRKYIAEQFKDVPVYLFGHSMGTIISRVLLETEGDQYQKVALSGYVNPNTVAGIGAFLVSFISLFKGKKGHSKLINNMAMGPFTKAVEDRKTDLDWLSYNKENVQKYIADPLCGVEFTLGSYHTLMKLLGLMAKPKNYNKVSKEQPILLISGDADPCTGGEKGRIASKDVLTKAGYENIEVNTLEHMRHEILNETEKEKVYQDLLEFFKK